MKMKKILCIALALAMVLAMGAVTFAEDTVNETLNDTTSTSATGAPIKAKIVQDTSISAQVSWGDMQFTYTESTNTWTASGNKITVKNTSPRSSIKTEYEYTPKENAFGDYPYFHTSDYSTEGFVVAAGSTKLGDVFQANTKKTGSATLTTGSTDEHYILFETADDANKLDSSNWVEVGSLKVTISKV